MHQNGLVFESGDYRNKFKVIQALWNPKVDILALANQSGEVCLKRFYWKTGWQKKISSELMFFSRNNKQYGEVGEFSSMCWSPDGSILAVAFENGVCHLLDVNDALILYSLKIESRPVLLKWFKIDGLEKELSETRRNQLFSNEKSFNSLECENLRTKDSEQQRDHYKIVYGIQNFCHSRVGAKLLDTALIVVTQNEDYMHGFDVYISGMLLVKSVLFDYGFLAPACDTFQMKIHDICMLPNQNLQFAVSAPLKYGQLGRPEFDLVAGFTQPIDETTDRESTYLVEYDLQFRNKQFMSSSALLAARTCHIFHLLTCLRENFYRSTVEWEAISGQFHNNVFGTVYSKYEEESNGLMADFALDFISYIITGNYSEAFSQAFFNDIKLKDWKPAREFVGKHIPSFLQTINRYLSPIVEILYVHLNSLKGELERFERNSTCQWGQRRVFAMFGAKTGDVSKTVEQVSKCIQAVCHLSGRLKHLAMVASKNWAELKYVLQLLSSHPDNEQLKIEIEDDYDGIPKLVDFEILLNFISEALVDPAKKEGFGGWTNFLHHWKTILAEEEPTRRHLICNPNWLKHRLFDKIGPLLGICTDLPKPPPPSRENVENKFDCSHATTINDSIDLCFKTLSDVYLFGLKDLDGNSEQPSYAKSHCLEFCHPHPISKLQLFSWPDVEETKKYQKLEDQQENLSSLNNLKQKVGTTELKSLILIHRSSTSTLQTYACVGSHLQPHDSAQVNICSPEHVLKLGVFGQSGEIQSRFEKLHADEIEQSYEDGQFKVLSFEPYGMGVLHLAVSFNEHKNPETGVYILRVNVNGQLKKIDTNVLTYADDPILMTSPSSSTAIMFEKGFEAVKWFDLEDKNSRLRRKSLVAEPESHILKAHSIQKIDIPGHSTRSALNRKRKLNAAQQQDENARPSTADLMEMDRNDENEFDDEELSDIDDEDDGESEPTVEQLRRGYLVVEMDDPMTPLRIPSPTFTTSPVALRLNDYGSFTPVNLPGSPPASSILNMVHYGSPATTSTASSPHRLLISRDDDEESRTEDNDDYAIEERANTAADDEEDRTEHDVEIVDSMENSRDDDLNNQQNASENAGHLDEEMEQDMLNNEDEEETREAL